tara:strand:+ start:1163 stop:1375 length:213 start_codon:yes stop_codon:yes gene_type:complete
MMPSRQVKISVSNLDNYYQKWLTFILKDGVVIFGKMTSIEENKILYQNSSMKSALIFRSEVDEVWRDIQF